MSLLSGKQKRYLKSMAHSLKPIVQVGKLGVGGNWLEQLELVLEARELIKVSVLETSPLTRDEVVQVIVEETGAECVQTIGRLAVLYRRSQNNPQIEFPKATLAKP